MFKILSKTAKRFHVFIYNVLYGEKKKFKN